MRVGWYTHHVKKTPEIGSESLKGLFTGEFVGGAEMSDEEYKKFAPSDYVIQTVTPETWVEPKTFDTVVVTGTEGFNDSQLLDLSGNEPFVFVHHLQTPRSSLKELIEKSRLFVTHTPAHMFKELSWVKPKKTAQVLSAFDTSEIKISNDKEQLALWAARNHPLKGEMQAFNWALKMEIPFLPLTNKPRSEVLQAMSYAEYFVHLPLAFESECRAVMEAVLSGCKVVTNQNVGITSVKDWDEPEALKNMVDKAGETFWRLVNQ